MSTIGWMVVTCLICFTIIVCAVVWAAVQSEKLKAERLKAQAHWTIREHQPKDG